MTEATTQSPIQFTESSIQDVLTICETIRRKNPKNEISVTMSKGIADFVEQNGFVTPRQAAWLCRNADYWNIKRPGQLAEVELEPRSKPAAVETPHVTDQAAKDVANRLVASIERIEKLLEARL